MTVQHKVQHLIANPAFRAAILGYTSSIVGVLVTLQLARIYGSSGFAWIALGIAMGAVCDTIVNFGSQQAYIRASRESKDPVGIATESLGRRLGLSIPVTASLGVVALVHQGIGTESAAIIVYGVWTMLVGLYPLSWYDYLGRTEDQLKFLLAERIFSAIAVNLSILTPLDLSLTATGLLLLSIRLVSVLAQIAYWRRTSEDWRDTDRFSIVAPWCSTRGTSAKVMISLVCNNLTIYGAQAFLSADEIAAYGITIQILSPAIIFQGLFIRINRRNIGQFVNGASVTDVSGVFRMCRQVAMVSAGFCAALYAISIYIVRYLNDPGFVAVPSLVLLLSIWVIMIGAGKVLSQVLLEIERDTYFMTIGILGAMSSLLLAALLVPAGGAPALAGVVVLTRAITIFLHGSNVLKAAR